MLGWSIVAMVVVLLVVLVVAVAWVVNASKTHEWEWSELFKLVGGCVFLGFIFSFVAVILLAVGTDVFARVIGAELETEMVSSVEISALNDDSQLYGRFYLGSGYISTSKQYYFMENIGGSKHMSTVPAASTYLFESNDEKPRVETYEVSYASDFFDLFGMSRFGNLYKIYIPEGAVTEEFDVDLQ